MENKNISKLVRYAMMMALTTVATMLIKIPSPATKGYINLGDGVVILSGLLLGRSAGFIIGGVGSAMADLLLGYTHYIPITFIVKGIEGFLVGYLVEKEFFKGKIFLVAIIAGLWMALGYYIFQIPLYGAKAALLSIPGNIVQGLVGAVSSMALYKPLRRMEYFKKGM